MVARLKALLTRGYSRLIRYSESFSDPVALMAECERLGFEGIVSKRKDSVDRSGPRCGWIKTKCQGWIAMQHPHARRFES